MVISWNRFKHRRGGQVNDHPWPAGYHHRHPQQRNGSQTFTPITQQPTSFRGRILQHFFFAFPVIKLHFSEAVLKSPVPSFPQEHRPACTRVKPGRFTLSISSPFPRILPKKKGLWLCNCIAGALLLTQECRFDISLLLLPPFKPITPRKLLHLE